MANDSILIQAFFRHGEREALIKRVEESNYSLGPRITQNDENAGFVTILVSDLIDVDAIRLWPEVWILNHRMDHGYDEKEPQCRK